MYFELGTFLDENYAHIVLESSKGSDLFTLESLLILCRLEYELIQAKHYKELCTQTVKKPKKCCRPWSLANYIAQLHNRTSCLAIIVSIKWDTSTIC